MKDKKVLWFDVETTGLSAYHNDIVELAYEIEVNGKVEVTADLVMAPFNPNKIQEKALQIHGRTEEEILLYPDPKDVYHLVLKDWAMVVNKFDKTDKMYIGGFNVHFDIEFLLQFFKKCNDKFIGSWINWRRLDVLDLCYRLDYGGLLDLPNYKLKTVAEHFGIEIDAHQAISDIHATREIDKIARAMLKGVE